MSTHTSTHRSDFLTFAYLQIYLVKFQSVTIARFEYVSVSMPKSTLQCAKYVCIQCVKHLCDEILCVTITVDVQKINSSITIRISQWTEV